MSARRQSSTTSLARYARVSSPDLSNRSLDFCNAFWGAGDGGVDVLFARLRGAARTMEELRAFWKERASIEEDYAKRMSKLAKQPLGKDEIGELRNSLDTLRLETDRQATSHLQLCQQVKSDLESRSSAFIAKQVQFKRVAQSAVERAFKAKQTQETYVAKAKEKYESDCMRINSYTAQSTLVQGKDLEKIQLKLERAKQTVTQNERDFANFARALQDTVARWEKDWKMFCDVAQDLEAERIEFMKDDVWAYANAVSTVCVSDDESCEQIRVVLEQLEPERDMENFVRDYGTGSQIPEPPQFISYNSPEAYQASQAPRVRYANFPRSSQRQFPMQEVMRRPPQPEEEPAGPGQAGRGAGGGGLDRLAGGTQSRPSSRVGVYSSAEAGGNESRGVSPTSASAPSTGLSASVTSSAATSATPSAATSAISSVATSATAATSRPTSATAEPPVQHTPLGPSHKTLLQVGENTYDVDPDRDPQTTRSGLATKAAAPAASSVGVGTSRPSSGATKVGDEGDPLAKQMAELRNSATIRRTSMNVMPASAAAKPPARTSGISPGETMPAHTHAHTASTSSALSAPSNASNPSRDFRNSAEFVVGGPPPGSRPTSPANPPPPTANFMQPPSATSTSPLPVEQVLGSYEQSFPGERRSPLSRASSRNGPAPGPGSAHLSQNQNLSSASAIERPVSREGYAGIGARRSPSPQPPQPPSQPRPPSAAGPPQANRASYAGPSPTSMAPPPGSGIPRSTSPARAENFGIALDATGHVVHDALAEQYRQQKAQPPPSQASVQGYGIPQRGQSIRVSTGPPPPPPLPYGAPPGAYPVSQPTGGYVPAPPPTQAPPAPPVQVPGPQRQNTGAFYNPHSPSYTTAPHHPHQPHHMATLPPQTAQPVYQPPPPPVQPVQVPVQPTGGYAAPNGYAYGHHQTGSNGVPVQNGMPLQNGAYGHYGYGQNDFRAPSPQVVRSPSPAPPAPAPAPAPPSVPTMVSPTGAVTDDGRPVLFYVKALYDYQATIEEEFDFQAGDVIAVTSTPEDGWWTGELLDDSRRFPGKSVFPSNFVCLF